MWILLLSIPTFEVPCVTNGSECEDVLDLVGQSVVLAEASECHQSALGVAHVVDGGDICFLCHVIQHSWQVVFGHFVPREVPEFATPRIHVHVCVAVSIRRQTCFLILPIISLIEASIGFLLVTRANIAISCQNISKKRKILFILKFFEV